LDEAETQEPRGVLLRHVEDKSDTSPRTGSAEDVSGPSIELSGARLWRNYITCPARPTAEAPRPSLGIRLPYLYLTLLVPPRAEFSLEVTVRDDRDAVRRFRASTYQAAAVVRPDVCALPLRLAAAPPGGRPTRDALCLPPPDPDPSAGGDGPDTSPMGGAGAPCWNRVCLPLAELARRAYGTRYVEALRVRIHATCRLKRVYFVEEEVNEDDELPEDFRLYFRPAER